MKNAAVVLGLGFASILAAAASAEPNKLFVCRGNTHAPNVEMYITNTFSVVDGLKNWSDVQAALVRYMQAHYKPTFMLCDNFATQADADAHVATLVKWAHSNKLEPVFVTFTYP